MKPAFMWLCSEATCPFCTDRKRKRAVGRDDNDEGSSSGELHHHHRRRDGKTPALHVSKSYTVQPTIRSSSNQDKPGFNRETINTDDNQAYPGFTSGTINTDYNQASPGFSKRTITKDHNQTMATITTKPNQSKSDLDRVPLSNKPCSVRSSAARPPISRWAQFLPVPHPQEEEEGDDDDGEEKESPLINMESKPLDRPVSSATLGDRELGHQSEVPDAVSSQTLLFNTGDDFDAFDFDDMF